MASIIDVPMGTSNSVALVDDAVAAELFQALPHLSLNLAATARNADVAGVVGKMIADHRPVLPSPVDNVCERRGCLRVGRIWVRGDPIVHFGDVRRGIVGAKELAPVSSPALCHEFGLTFHRAPAAGDANGRMRELMLDGRNHLVNIGWTRLW